MARDILDVFSFFISKSFLSSDSHRLALGGIVTSFAFLFLSIRVYILAIELNFIAFPNTKGWGLAKKVNL